MSIICCALVSAKVLEVAHDDLVLGPVNRLLKLLIDKKCIGIGLGKPTLDPAAAADLNDCFPAVRTNRPTPLPAFVA